MRKDIRLREQWRGHQQENKLVVRVRKTKDHAVPTCEADLDPIARGQRLDAHTKRIRATLARIENLVRYNQRRKRLREERRK